MMFNIENDRSFFTDNFSFNERRMFSLKRLESKAEEVFLAQQIRVDQDAGSRYRGA